MCGEGDSAWHISGRELVQTNQNVEFTNLGKYRLGGAMNA